ncbi:FAD-dependent monooxygenase [Actinosynnema sp. NPDC020468]|uniref:FAD-dependent oxidoreductase n=1 Tax=Actinosynnema sp. NPDC020468 TaxID=3154488 RepID=UPI003404F677
MKVVIVGAGLAGPLLAQGLTRAGITVELYERDRADRPAQGYRVHLEPEGDLALRECLSPDRYEQVVATSGKRGTGVRILSPGLEVVHEILVPESAETDETGHHRTVDRGTLRRLLLEGLELRDGASFERYELLPDGRVRTFFADGAVTDADLLVGADGTYSPVRGQLLPHAVVEDTGQATIFGRTPLTERSRPLVPAAALDGFCAVAGDDGRFMPLAAHEYRSGGEDYLMWVIGAPRSRFPADLAALDQSSLRDTAADLVADWPAPLAGLVRLSEPNSLYATTIRSARRPPRWDTVPVTLMGDAAHTMVPAGIGAAVALRDAATLCRGLTSGESLSDAVRGYENAMLDYGFAAVERSRRAG